MIYIKKILNNKNFYLKNSDILFQKKIISIKFRYRKKNEKI